MRLNVTLLAVVGWLAYHEWRFYQMSLTRKQLDDNLAAAPALIATAVSDTLTPILQPLIDKLNANPEDFSAEADQLNALPDSVGTAVGDTIRALFAPTTPTTPDSP